MPSKHTQSAKRTSKASKSTSKASTASSKKTSSATTKASTAKKAEAPKVEEKVPATKVETKAKAPKPAAKPETKTETPKAEAVKSEAKPAAKAEPAKPAKKTEAPKTAAKAEPAKPEAKPAAKAEPSKAEAAKPETKAAASAPKPAAKKAEPAAPKAEAVAPKAEPAAPKAEAVAPKAEPATPKAAEPKADKPAAAKSAAKAEKKDEPKPTTTSKVKPVDKAAPAPKAEPAPAPKTEPTAKAEPAPKVETKPAAKATSKPEEKPAAKPEPKPEVKPAAKAEPAAKAAPAAKPEPKATPKPEPEPEPEKEVKPVTESKPEAKPEEVEPAKEEKPEPKADVESAAEAPKTDAEPEATPEPEPEAAPEPEPMPEPRRSVAFIGSECYPFVKTGGLGDVMYALPKALVKLNCDVKVILPRYACIKQEWQEKMVYKGAFDMDLCADGTSYYVGIMEYEQDGVVYDFIDNEWFFTAGNPYINLVDDIPKYCYFAKAALAALNYLNWIPDVIHCHDWQAALVPVYLKTMFQETPLARSKTVLTIHNLRFQGKYSMDHIKYWSGLPDYVFNEGALQENWTDANMLKGGLAYTDMITTVSGNYAREIQTPEYGEGLDAHLRYHSGKLRGIVNGIDIDIWNPKTDKLLDAPYDATDVIEQKKEDKAFLQHELGLEEDPDKMVIGLISRLTNQKGLDLVNDIFQQMLDGNTQVVILGTGDHQYEDSFRWFENANKGTVCSNIMYDEARSHQIYAGADALLVPSRFEPCGLTQLIAMHYGTIPIVRETGGLKDTVEPYNKYTNQGNGFSFDRYESGLLLDAINRAKTLFFTNRYNWDQMVVRDMNKDVSWANSANLYRDLYLELTA